MELPPTAAVVLVGRIPTLIGSPKLTLADDPVPLIRRRLVSLPRVWPIENVRDVPVPVKFILPPASTSKLLPVAPTDAVSLPI